MPGHTHLVRRGAVCYVRCAVPNDLRQTYGKRGERISLRTRDVRQAVRSPADVGLAVVQRFDAQRRKLEAASGPILPSLTDEQLAAIRSACVRFRLEEDGEMREDGFEEVGEEPEGRVLVSPRGEVPCPGVEAAGARVEDMDAEDRFNLARRKVAPFFAGEAQEVLGWDGIGLRLAPDPPSWPKVVPARQEVSIKAAELIRRRSKGDVVPTPPTSPRSGPVGALACRRLG